MGLRTVSFTQISFSILKITTSSHILLSGLQPARRAMKSLGILTRQLLRSEEDISVTDSAGCWHDCLLQPTTFHQHQFCSSRIAATIKVFTTNHFQINSSRQFMYSLNKALNILNIKNILLFQKFLQAQLSRKH